MKEYAQQSRSKSRTLESNPKASRQAPISYILQGYKNSTLGRQFFESENVKNKDLQQVQTRELPQIEVALQQYMRHPIQTTVARKKIDISPNHTNSPFVRQFCSYDSSCPYSGLSCPIHKYSQALAPSRKPFLSAHESYIGETAMVKEDHGITPSASEVRVAAKKTPYSRTGAGLDEWLPTDQRGIIASSKIPGLAGIQSGARIPTDHAILVSPTGKLSGHTGMFPKITGRGSTHTASQSHAHDLRRVPLPPSTTREKAVVEIVCHGLASLAHGKQIIESDDLTGAVPNYKGAQAIGQSTSDATRVGLATMQHESREHIKSRLNQYAALYSIPRPSTPERTRIEADGTGGEYSTDPKHPIRTPSPVPPMEGVTPSQISANETAYLTDPSYPQSKAESKKIKCPYCNTFLYPFVTMCGMCGKTI